MRWNASRKNFQESAKVDAFIGEIKQVCLRHGLTLTLDLDNSHNYFEVELFTHESDTNFIMDARIGLTLQHLVEENVNNKRGMSYD
jgi:hypothetical protein